MIFLFQQRDNFGGKARKDAFFTDLKYFLSELKRYKSREAYIGKGSNVEVVSQLLFLSPYC